MQKTDNRSVGGRFEQEMANILAENGFWAHVLQQNKSGQPADIIAVKGKYHTLIDCKVCDKGYFTFDRIEDNQRMAMGAFYRKAGEVSYFALKMPDGSIWMVSILWIATYERKKHKRITQEEMEQISSMRLEEWLKMTDTWSKDI